MFNNIFLKHAGFNEPYRSRLQQKAIQVENAERIESVMNSPWGVIHRRPLKNVKIDKDIEPVKLGDIVRVHDSNYIGEVKRTCAMIEEDDLVEYGF